MQPWKRTRSPLRSSRVSPHKPVVIQHISFMQADKLSCTRQDDAFVWIPAGILVARANVLVLSQQPLASSNDNSEWNFG
jgi:hypothetical protein